MFFFSCGCRQMLAPFQPSAAMNYLYFHRRILISRFKSWGERQAKNEMENKKKNIQHCMVMNTLNCTEIVIKDALNVSREN